jgi:FkbM family methyltransferase
VGPAGRVIAVEPVAENQACLRRTIDANRLSNVTLVDAAAGEQDGVLTLSLSDGCPGAHSAVLQRGGPHREVPLTAIDSLVARLSLDRVDFMKVDVEGYEPQVIQGARRTLGRFRPTVVAATYHLPEHRALLPAVAAELLGDGYRIQVRRAAPAVEPELFAVPHRSRPRFGTPASRDVKPRN